MAHRAALICCCCCCCCYDEPVRHCLYRGWGERGPKEMRNSTRLWIWRDPSLPRGSWQPFINWGTTQGRLSLPTADVLSTIVKRSMLTDVNKLSSCSRFSDSVLCFTGQKTQPTASKYWRKMNLRWLKTKYYCKNRKTRQIRQTWVINHAGAFDENHGLWFPHFRDLLLSLYIVHCYGIQQWYYCVCSGSEGRREEAVWYSRRPWNPPVEQLSEQHVRVSCTVEGREHVARRWLLQRQYSRSRNEERRWLLATGRQQH